MEDTMRGASQSKLMHWLGYGLPQTLEKVPRGGNNEGQTEGNPR